jgi:hypothetical protein
MDAYDLSDRLMNAWREVVPKNSGELKKTNEKVRVCVWTEYGYREVVGISINKLGFIEIELDE